MWISTEVDQECPCSHSFTLCFCSTLNRSVSSRFFYRCSRSQMGAMVPFFFMISLLRALISGVKVTPSMVIFISRSMRSWMRRSFFSCQRAIESRNLLRSVFSLQLQRVLPCSPYSSMAWGAWYFSIRPCRKRFWRSQGASSSASVLKRRCMDCLRCLRSAPAKLQAVFVRHLISRYFRGSLLMLRFSANLPSWLWWAFLMRASAISSLWLRSQQSLGERAGEGSWGRGACRGCSKGAGSSRSSSPFLVKQWWLWASLQSTQNLRGLFFSVIIAFLSSAHETTPSGGSLICSGGGGQGEGGRRSDDRFYNKIYSSSIILQSLASVNNKFIQFTCHPPNRLPPARSLPIYLHEVSWKGCIFAFLWRVGLECRY